MPLVNGPATPTSEALMPGPDDGSGALGERESKQLSEWLSQLSDRWTDRRLVELVKQLPAQGRLRRAALVEMIAVDLRQRWQRGERARVEGYLKAFPELGTPQTVPLPLLLAEHEARKAAGAADESKLSQRFPGRMDELRQALAQSSPPTTAPLSKHPGAHTPPPLPAPIPGPDGRPETFGRHRILRPPGS